MKKGEAAITTVKKWDIVGSWKKRSQLQRLSILFLISELIVIAIVVVAIITLGPVLDSLLSDSSLSELRLLEQTYREKIDLINDDFQNLAREPQFTNYSPSDYLVVQQKLADIVAAHRIEYASLVHLHEPSKDIGGDSRIIVSANSGRTDTLTPGDLLKPYTCCMSNPSQSDGASTLTYGEYLKEGAPLWRERVSDFDPVVADHVVDRKINGIFRWSLTPVVTGNDECNGGIGMVIVGGDMVNGKVPIVEVPTNLFGSGYAAVWYMDEEGEGGGGGGGGELLQAVSYVGFDRGVTATLSGHALVNTVPLRGVYNSQQQGEAQVFIGNVLGLEYTVAAKRIPGTPVVLARGPSRQVRDSENQAAGEGALSTISLILVVDFFCGWYAFLFVSLPLKKLARKISRRKEKDMMNEEDFPARKGYVRSVLLSNGCLVGLVLLVLFNNLSVITDMQASKSVSELNVLSYMYQGKLTRMRWLAHWTSRSDAVRGAVADWQSLEAAAAAAAAAGEGSPLCAEGSSSSSSSSSSSADMRAVRESLKESSKALGVELAMLLDSHGRVILDANGDRDDFYRCGQDPSPGLVAEVLSSPKTIISPYPLRVDDYQDLFLGANTDADVAGYAEPYVVKTSTSTDSEASGTSSASEGTGGEGASGVVVESLLSPEYTGEDAWVRWVATPVYTRNTTAAAAANCATESQADGVLLLGDVLNGKLAITGQTQDILGDGYTALYGYDYSIDEFVLLSSLFSNAGVTEADVELAGDSGEQLLLDAFLTGQRQTLSRLQVAGLTNGEATLSVSVTPIPAAVWIDEFGTREVEGAVQGVLVRGTPVERTQAVKSDEAHMVMLFVTTLAVVVGVRLGCAYELFRPVIGYRREMKECGALSATMTGTSGATTSNGSSNSSGSSSATGDGKRRRRRASWVVRLFPMKLLQLLILLPAVGCVVVAAMYMPEEMEGVAPGRVRVAAEASARCTDYMFAVMEERAVTVRLLDADAEAEAEAEAESGGGGGGGANSRYYDEVVVLVGVLEEELSVARGRVDAASGALMDAVGVVPTAVFDVTVQMRAVRKEVFGLVRERQDVDDRLSSARTSFTDYVSHLNDLVLELLARLLLRPSRDAGSTQLGMGLWQVLRLTEAFDRATLLLDPLLATEAEAGRQFGSVDEYVAFSTQHATAASARRHYELGAGPGMQQLWTEAVPRNAQAWGGAWHQAASTYPTYLLPPDFPPSLGPWRGNSTAVLEGYQKLGVGLAEGLLGSIEEYESQLASEEAGDAAMGSTLGCLCFCILFIVTFLERSKHHKAKKWRKARKLNKARLSWWMLQRGGPAALALFVVVFCGVALGWIVEEGEEVDAGRARMDVAALQLSSSRLASDLVAGLGREREASLELLRGGWGGEGGGEDGGGEGAWVELDWFEGSGVQEDTDALAASYLRGGWGRGEEWEGVERQLRDLLPTHRLQFLSGNVSTPTAVSDPYSRLISDVLDQQLSVTPQLGSGEMLRSLTSLSALTAHHASLTSASSLLATSLDEASWAWAGGREGRDSFANHRAFLGQQRGELEVATATRASVHAHYASRVEPLPARLLLGQWDVVAGQFKTGGGLNASEPTSGVEGGGLPSGAGLRSNSSVVEAGLVEVEEQLRAQALESVARQREELDKRYSARVAPLATAVALLPLLIPVVLLVYSGRVITLTSHGPAIVKESLKKRKKVGVAHNHKKAKDESSSTFTGPKALTQQEQADLAAAATKQQAAAAPKMTLLERQRAAGMNQRKMRRGR